jgi:hypothetical protein
LLDNPGGELNLESVSPSPFDRLRSLSEDLSPAKEQESDRLIGRRRRLSAADYPSGHSPRTLQEVSAN